MIWKLQNYCHYSKGGIRNSFLIIDLFQYITTNVKKILDLLNYNRLISFIKHSDVINKVQYDFLEKHSTSLALMGLIEDITDKFDKKTATAGVFIDLKKAFDTIDPNILISELCHYGIRGITLKWLKDYLSHGSQYVVYNEVRSTNKLCGISQWSILGPMLLFCIYMIWFILFTSNTNVFYADSNLVDVMGVLNYELKNVSVWFRVNKLSLKVGKRLQNYYRWCACW